MKQTTSLTISLVIAVLIIVGTLLSVNGNNSFTGTAVKSPTMNFPAGRGPSAQKGGVGSAAEENSVIKDGIQYVTITAQGGYSPRASSAKAGVVTKLVVKTNGTYDCSSSLVIRSLSFRKILPNTGETVIDVGTPKVGDTLQGVCGMGMYSFVISFK